MTRPAIIIITGHPSTGKTRLSREIARRFNLPVIAKDDIKELLFNDLGWSDRPWSKKLGVAAYSILHHIMEELLSAGASFIVESNFDPVNENKTLIAWQAKYHFESLQIVCETDHDVLLERFKKRVESGERHPGHVDHTSYQEMKERLAKGNLDPLDIGGQVLRVDTTDFKKIDHDAIFNAVESALAGNKKIVEN